VHYKYPVRLTTPLGLIEDDRWVRVCLINSRALRVCLIKSRALHVYASRVRLWSNCIPGKCKCKSSKCSSQRKEPAVNIDDLGEAKSSDSEPEDFGICVEECSTTIWQYSKYILLCPVQVWGRQLQKQNQYVWTCCGITTAYSFC